MNGFNALSEDAGAQNCRVIGLQFQTMTCGLQSVTDPTSHHLTPQETTVHATALAGADGDDLSCPGSSVVADADDESRK
jgi:hypothetical protein